MKGYRTIVVGLGTAVAGAGLTYLAGVDWTQYVGPNFALMVAGAIQIGMRMITTGPIAGDTK